MNRILLLIGGLLNALFVVFHIRLGWQIHLIQTIPPGSKALMEMLNAAGIIFIAFIAYASLFCVRDVLGGVLGKVVLFTAFLLYISRAIEEIIISTRFSTLEFSVCLVMGVIYLIPLLRPEKGSPV